MARFIRLRSMISVTLAVGFASLLWYVSYIPERPLFHYALDEWPLRRWVPPVPRRLDRGQEQGFADRKLNIFVVVRLGEGASIDDLQGRTGALRLCDDVGDSPRRACFVCGDTMHVVTEEDSDSFILIDPEHGLRRIPIDEGVATEIDLGIGRGGGNHSTISDRIIADFGEEHAAIRELLQRRESDQ